MAGSAAGGGRDGPAAVFRAVEKARRIAAGGDPAFDASVMRELSDGALPSAALSVFVHPGGLSGLVGVALRPRRLPEADGMDAGGGCRKRRAESGIERTAVCARQ